MTLTDYCAVEGCLNARADAPGILAIARTVEGMAEVELFLCVPHRNGIVIVAQDEHNPPPRSDLQLMHSGT